MSGISGISTDEADGDGHLDLHYPKSQVYNLAFCTICRGKYRFRTTCGKRCNVIYRFWSTCKGRYWFPATCTVQYNRLERYWIFFQFSKMNTMLPIRYILMSPITKNLQKGCLSVYIEHAHWLHRSNVLCLNKNGKIYDNVAKADFS